MEYKMKNVFGLRWNCRELKGIVKLSIFGLVTMMLQWLRDGWRTSNLKKRQTRCLLNKQVHHGANVGAFIIKSGVPGQEGANGNAAERYRGDSNMAALRVAGVIKEFAHESLTFKDAVACELFLYIDYMGFTYKSKAEIWVTKGLLVEAKEVILGMEIFRTRSGNTLRVSRFRCSNEMSVQILLGGHSMLSLEGGLSGNHDEEKKTKVSSGYCYLCLDEGGPQSEVPTLVEVDAYQRRLTIITKPWRMYPLFSNVLKTGFAAMAGSDHLPDLYLGRET
ncbi:hypothetical protein Tco_0548221 [Tanacetum coccineum]